MPQLCPVSFYSMSTVRRHLGFGRPLFLFLSRIQRTAVLVLNVCWFRSTWPILFHRLPVMMVRMYSLLVSSNSCPMERVSTGVDGSLVRCQQVSSRLSPSVQPVVNGCPKRCRWVSCTTDVHHSVDGCPIMCQWMSCRVFSGVRQTAKIVSSGLRQDMSTYVHQTVFESPLRVSGARIPRGLKNR